jgi:hypothetical protein
MADPRRFEHDELLIRPGTYFNPQTEILIIVDDSPEVDADIFEADFDGPEWVLVSDEVPVDEHQRDELIERFQIRHQPGSRTVSAEDEDDDEPEPEHDELEEDEEPGHG